jgi:hypothetical protein
MKLSTHLHAMLRLRVCGIYATPYTSARHGVEVRRETILLYHYNVPYFMRLALSLKQFIKLNMCNIGAELIKYDQIKFRHTVSIE